MVSSAATSVTQYLAELPPERRAIVARVREVVRASLPAGYEEAMGYGMIVWSIPLSRYPETYNGQPLGYAALAAQKNYYSLYLPFGDIDQEHLAAFERAFAAAGVPLDKGKVCVRFTSLDRLPLDAVAAAIASTPPDEYIARHERARAAAGATRKAPAKKASPTKAASKKAPAKKPATKKAATKQASAKRATKRR